MATRRRFLQRREPIGVVVRRNVATIEALAGRTIPELHNYAPALPKKRAAPSTPSTDIEAPVISAVGELLAAHPAVLFAVRQNSGAMPYSRDGRPVPIWFYRLVRKPGDMTITDYWGIMRDGRPVAIECKRPSWKSPHTEREKRQHAFIKMIEAIGGLGGFVRSVGEAQVLLGAGGAI